MTKGADIEEALCDERDELVEELACHESMAAMHEAASIVCHRIAQFGSGSLAARDAHQRWAMEWLAWAESQKAGGS